MKKSSSTNNRKPSGMIPNNLNIDMNLAPQTYNLNSKKPPMNNKPGMVHSKPFNNVNNRNLNTSNNRANSATKKRVDDPLRSNSYRVKANISNSYKATSNIGSKRTGYDVTNSNIGNMSNKPMNKNAYTFNKEGGSQMPDDYTDDGMQDQLAEVWKVFGRETEAGKALWRTYAAGNKKKVNYPSVMTKPWDPREALKIVEKPCPQQTKIEYPPTFTKQDIARNKMMSKFHKIDFVQHRKPRDEIMQELRNYYSIVDVPINRAVNRDQMIDDLQDKFRYSKPKKYNNDGSPFIKEVFLAEEEEKKIAYAAEANMRRELNKGYFGAEKPGDKPMVQIKKPEITSNDELIEHNIKQSKDLVNELGDIFDQVVTEIDERQQYMMEVTAIGADDLAEKTRKEIVDRVAELQKITRLMNEEKAKLKVMSI